MPESRIEIIGLELPLVRKGNDLPKMIDGAAGKAGGIRDGDILVVASKVVSVIEGRTVGLSKVKPSMRARKVANKTGQSAEFVELVLREADRVLNIEEGAVLTLKDGHICVNAGVDLSNAPPGHAILWPKNPNLSARRILKSLARGRRLGVVISDSVVRPLRLGTVGQAIGWAGLSPVQDCRKAPDLYGKPLRVTFRAIADQIASAAQLVAGEADEKRPVVIVRGLDAPSRGPRLLIRPKRCIYFVKEKPCLKI